MLGLGASLLSSSVVESAAAIEDYVFDLVSGELTPEMVLLTTSVICGT